MERIPESTFRTFQPNLESDFHKSFPFLPFLYQQNKSGPFVYIFQIGYSESACVWWRWLVRWCHREHMYDGDFAPFSIRHNNNSAHCVPCEQLLQCAYLNHDPFVEHAVAFCTQHERLRKHSSVFANHNWMGQKMGNFVLFTKENKNNTMWNWNKLIESNFSNFWTVQIESPWKMIKIE